MDKSFHYMIMACQSHFSKKIMDELSALGLTAGQPKVLDYLSLHNGSVQKDIASGCCIDKATITGILSRMEEKGLIVRKNEDGNRRSLHVYLTKKGTDLSIIIQNIFQKYENAAMNGISSDNKKIFLETLFMICSNLTDMEKLQ